MGITDESVNLAFDFLLGAIGVADALAFGLGFQEVASREADSRVMNLKEDEQKFKRAGVQQNPGS